MTLYDYIYSDPDKEEFAVIDNVYDVETYFIRRMTGVRLWLP